MIKKLVKLIASKLYQLAKEYQHEQIRERFKLHKTVSYSNISLEGTISIGENTYLNDYTRIDSGAQSKIIIGRHCAIGRYVHITSKTHSLILPTTDEQNSEIKMEERDVLIGNYVWIGDKVTVLPGVRIGDYAILAAHTVVTKNVEPFEIVGGIPAKHIRYNTDHYRYLNTSK